MVLLTGTVALVLWDGSVAGHSQGGVARHGKGVVVGGASVQLYGRGGVVPGRVVGCVRTGGGWHVGIAG